MAGGFNWMKRLSFLGEAAPMIAGLGMIVTAFAMPPVAFLPALPLLLLGAGTLLTIGSAIVNAGNAGTVSELAENRRRGGVAAKEIRNEGMNTAPGIEQAPSPLAESRAGSARLRNAFERRDEPGKDSQAATPGKQAAAAPRPLAPG